MAEIANTLWYRLGTITVTDGSTKVTGVGTHFTTAGINPGATLRIDGKFYAHEVKRVVSDTELELAAPYYGGNASAASYSIDRNFQSTTNAKLAADVTDLVRLYEQVRDGTMLTIEGKSAYRVAVDNGFKGSESEWLESLKGNAEEIAEINSKLGRIYINNAAAHNSIYRGKNLGTSITAAQMNAVKNGSFDDLYVGDYWPLPIDGTTYAYITGCDIRPTGFPHTGLARKTTHTICVWFQNNNWRYPVNDTATTEGHLKGSKMYTETLPALLTKIQTVIPDEYFNILEDYIADAANSSGGKTHVVAEAMKLFIPSAYNLGCVQDAPITNSAYNNVSKVFWPYCMHKPQISWYSCWIDSPANASDWYNKDNPDASIISIRANFLHYVWPYAFLG